MSPQRRAMVAIVFAVSLAIVVTAERDLLRRPASEVRGAKALWRIVSLNALGALVYLRWGRRASS